MNSLLEILDKAQTAGAGLPWAVPGVFSNLAPITDNSDLSKMSGASVPPPVTPRSPQPGTLGLSISSSSPAKNVKGKQTHNGGQKEWLKV